MRKDGFTLMELLVVIAILGILSLIAVPNAIDLYNEGVIKEMKIQESNVRDAANLFLEDYCLSKLDERLICPTSYEYGVYDSTKDKIVEKYVCLNDMSQGSDSYISGKVMYKKQSCNGFVTYYYDETLGVYNNPKTYLFCGEDEKTGYFTDSTVDTSRYCHCFNNCE